MPQRSETKHHQVLDTALPYIPNASVTAGIECYRSGSNVLTSIRGYAERRPGFAATTTDQFAAGNSIKRRFLWRRWAGVFIEMVNVVTSIESIVYKREIGTDTTVLLLFTSSSPEPFDFAVSNNHVFFCNGTDAQKYDGSVLTKWGIDISAAGIGTSVGGGTLTAQSGYRYCYTYGNSTTGHISSPSTPTQVLMPAAQSYTITENLPTTDSQVDTIHVYRTTDGGSIYFELPNSPIAYSVFSVSGFYDNSYTDEELSSVFAPLPHQNDPPPASQGVVWFAGRLWTFAGDKLFYSGWEEIPIDTSDAPEECFPPDNFFPFGQEITGLGTTTGALIVLCGGTAFKLTGDTLDTFKRDTLANKRGTRQRATITSNGKIVAWLDSSSTIQYTNGEEVRELSVPIRPDIEAIEHDRAAMTFHDDGLRHWLVLMDGGEGKLRIFDQDKERWMVPWELDGTLASIHSGESAPGVMELYIGRYYGAPYQMLQMEPDFYMDGGVAFYANLVTGLLPITGDPSPDSLAYTDYISVERNAEPLEEVSVCTDDDPESGEFVKLMSYERNPPYRTNGETLIEKQYPTNRGPIARRVSVRLDWPAEHTNFKLYSLDIAYHER